MAHRRQRIGYADLLGSESTPRTGGAFLLSIDSANVSMSSGGAQGLHGVQVVHCDLKPSNILLDKTRRIAKIGDVGLSRAMTSNHLSTRSTIFGTLEYAAPEVLTTARCSEKVSSCTVVRF